MNKNIDESVNEHYRGMADGSKPVPVSFDIPWITPRRLGLLFGVSLVMTVMFNGVI
ncbi:hypothetical protein MZD04_gp115 [Pseudomonas phage Psa21]|uniref:Uncharacterized protein n=1 Tax=Pseudomonas phage Psa21 TaxID=2530023 RepID=A0A481W5I4_9CAUD|nr:hypothetical protein MZD04_gp115 [Pseudomonas phage Psa21]QBJ02643.1 hypothetical protein PSA21_115 [Pseudomonas phage Psa21]